MKPKSSITGFNQQIRFQTRYEVPWTEGSQLFALDLSGWRTVDPAVNLEKCKHCGTCYVFCPTGCIEDKKDHYAPNVKYCKGCGICATECPVGAITMVETS